MVVSPTRRSTYGRQPYRSMMFPVQRILYVCTTFTTHVCGEYLPGRRRGGERAPPQSHLVNVVVTGAAVQVSQWEVRTRRCGYGSWQGDKYKGNVGRKEKKREICQHEIRGYAQNAMLHCCSRFFFNEETNALYCNYSCAGILPVSWSGFSTYSETLWPALPHSTLLRWQNSPGNSGGLYRRGNNQAFTNTRKSLGKTHLPTQKHKKC